MMKNTKIKDKIILTCIGVFLLIAGGSAFLNKKDDTPKSAAGMTLEERTDNDEKVLENGIGRKVEVDYEYDSIKITLNVNKTDQYSEDAANDIIDKTRDFIEDNRSKLTFEKDFYIYVYGKDGHLLGEDL